MLGPRPAPDASIVIVDGLSPLAPRPCDALPRPKAHLPGAYLVGPFRPVVEHDGHPEGALLDPDAEEVGAVLCDGVPLLAGLGCVERPGEREAGARVAVFRPFPLGVSLDPLRHALEGGREALAERRPQEPLLYRFDGPVVDLDAEVGHRVTSCACAVPLLRPPGDGGQPG